MDVLGRFNRYLLDNKLVSKSDKLLLAVSGGRDSMLMTWLFVQAGFEVEIAHCNFNLRGEESDGDEALVRNFAKEYNIPLHVNYFDTKAYAEKSKISIQMAARELRYEWFEVLRIQQNCSIIAVAQHKNDHVETVLFNLSRGTGLKGLTGIQKQRSRIIRPMLFLDAKEVLALVQQYQIPYRDDSSNFSNKYARNKIRLDIIPEFEKLNPDFISVMDENIQRFQESVDILDDFVNNLRHEIFVQQDELTWVIDKLLIQDKKIGLLYLFFEPFGFSKSVLGDLIASLDHESGRIFESDAYVLLLDREELILKSKVDKSGSIFIEEVSNKDLVWGQYSVEVDVLEDCVIEQAIFSTKIDLAKVQFPLQIRHWQEGDIFRPLGMKGKKKLSDLFIQRKVNVLEKDHVPILVNGNGEIIWVVGFQLDDRYKITQNTKKVLKLVFHK